MRLMPEALADQPLIFTLRDPVAAVGPFDQPSPIDDVDHPAMALDQPSALERIYGVGDARPPHTEHDRQELMGEWQSRKIEAVGSHEHPPGQPFLDLKSGIGERSLA